MKIEMNKNLEKRLLGYTTLAGAIITAGPSAQAAVIKTDPADQSGLQTINVDFNGDFSNDVVIKAGPFTSIASSDVEVQGTYAYVMGQNGLWGGPNWYASVLNSGVTIGSLASKSFATFGPGVLMYRSNGPWAGVSEKFIGIRFIIGGDTHYGWIKISCTTGPPYTLTIYEYAYENTADLSIKAGSDEPLPVELSSFTTVPENGAMNISWTTQNEIDNLGFVLERRLKEESKWKTIASYKTHTELKGQGNSTSPTDYKYADSNVFAGNTYFYRLSDIDINGHVDSKHVVQVTATEAVTPDETELLSAYPNPFNPGTTVQYKLDTDADVTLSVIDITGRTVRTLVTENQQAGNYTFSWDGMDNASQSTPSGIYMLVLKAGNMTKTQKVTRLR